MRPVLFRPEFENVGGPDRGWGRGFVLFHFEVRLNASGAFSAVVR